MDHAAILFGTEARATESIYMKPPQLALTLWCLVVKKKRQDRRERV